MKICKITSFYSDYLEGFYKANPFVLNLSYKEHEEVLFYDAFGWFDSWRNALQPLGYEMIELIFNAKALQLHWAKEQGIKNLSSISLEDVILKQIKIFNPEIIWFEDVNSSLVNLIFNEIKNARLIIGWAGSAFQKSKVWNCFDIILSCAPETVDYFKKNNFNCFHLNHAFDERINQRLQQDKINYEVTFIGQLESEEEYHKKRIMFLNNLNQKIFLKIYTNSVFKKKNNVGGILYRLCNFYNKLIRKHNFLNSYEFIQRANRGVYGLKMFQTIKNSLFVLNVHADSSPFYASNMRLFETTGVGSCLITDFRKNILDFFIPDEEIITYKSVDEAIEKINYLYEHKDIRDSISLKGQQKTLNKHTFHHRAVELDAILKKNLK